MIANFYPILDVEATLKRGYEAHTLASELRDAGVRLLQLRHKTGAPQQVLRVAAEITKIFEGRDCRLVMNDRADLAVLAGWNCVHVGQGDLPVGAVRQVVGLEAYVGVSTHSVEQVAEADGDGPDYIAVGPVFGTTTKLDAEPVVGLEGVRRARSLTSLPLVAIGGITRENARSVIDAGADSVAVISGLFVPGMTVAGVVEDFLQRLR